ncbi:50S ribosomal protein L25/general stress protein Ctc [Acidocella aromatica]|uniref:Large ribosomal subunit protein bL25 n=1 Tax=Acidocella aromatica TaxID=1303579 RepID=A0A840VQL6_9PROT|nr:50S ribosomal protein L25/general stress protein Ctc [Acidocella aromatica]MBB5373680.1 large subunit ribosomal protein L25 [Acidocella aromatica]
MANFEAVEASARSRAGKGVARATRREGKVPAVVYGAKQEPTLIALDPRFVLRELKRGGWRSRLYEISVDGQTTRALMRDVQFHPVTDQPEHVDFQRLVSGERVRVAVAVHFLNEATCPGLKRGGVLNVVRHKVEVEVDPDHIPEKFEVDLATLDINDNVRWHDLKGAENCQPVIVGRDFVVATLAPPTVSAEQLAADAAAAAAAAAAKAGKGGKKK